MSEHTRERYDRMKRLVDALAALVGLIILSPVILIVGILVRLRLGSPIIFSQARPGLGGDVFKLYKFRTMRNVDEASGLVSDEQRMSDFGRALRSTSLDELPTLLNVLKGDMSIVGPRPLLVRYLERYSPEQARRHEVRPGVTGLAQVSGRNALSWENKFALDVQYVDTRTPRVDLAIVWATLFSVAQRRDVAAPGQATMSEFLGSQEHSPTGNAHNSSEPPEMQ